MTALRCPMCQALVAHEHRASHDRYNCRPGLHQPPRAADERAWGITYDNDGRVRVHGLPVGRWKPITETA